MKTALIAMMTVLALMLSAGVAAAGATNDPIKWSQPPRLLNTPDPVAQRLILGWDEVSMTDLPIVADDFACKKREYITDLHWWGSYPGYSEEAGQAPPQHPQAFLIRFWSDVAAGEDPNADIWWSHPGKVLHKIVCENYMVEPYGYDIDPHLFEETGQVEIVDRCFQYNQKLDPKEYFLQEGTEDDPKVYWISIQAVFDASQEPPYPWGWKTRPHFFNDDAVVGRTTTEGVFGWRPIVDEAGNSWDMAYELTVPEPATLSLLLLGGAVLARRRARRR